MNTTELCLIALMLVSPFIGGVVAGVLSQLIDPIFGGDDNV